VHLPVQAEPRSDPKHGAHKLRIGDKVEAGIDAALAAGLHVKINTVALKGVNEDELGDLVAGAVWTSPSSK